MADETTKAAAPQQGAKQDKSASGGKTDETKAGGRRKNHPDNCIKCNKRLSKKQWYYRNGQFYCGKTCWKSADVKKTA
jgi:hypothetical protein